MFVVEIIKKQKSWQINKTHRLFDAADISESFGKCESLFVVAVSKEIKKAKLLFSLAREVGELKY